MTAVDTAAIRKVASDWSGFNYRNTIRVLCDALDEARAEQDYARTESRMAWDNHDRLLVRIAAVLALLPDRWQDDSDAQTVSADALRAALGIAP